MNSLRDRFRVSNYFAGLEPIDRVTALVLLALVAAIAIVFGVSMWTWTPAQSSGRFIPTPFELRFAGQAGT